MLVALLSAPLLYPGLLLCLPIRWLPIRWMLRAPMTWNLYFQVAVPNLYFPVRFDVTYVIRHDGALAAIRIEKTAPQPAQYVAGYWDDADDFGETPPDSTNSGTIAGGVLSIGPWQFTGSPVRGKVVWLSRPDASYEVEALAADAIQGFPALETGGGDDE